MSDSGAAETTSGQRTPAASRAARRPRPSTHSCKLIMAVTGLIFAIFVVVHLIGNLKVYAGAEDFDSYALWLRHALSPLLPYEGLLWILRAVLGVSLLLHLWCAVLLWLRARTARGPHRAPLRARSATARSMPLTGIALLAFVVFHILDLTTGHVGADGFRQGSAEASYAYANLVAGFERPAASIAYLVAMLALAAHVAQGVWMSVHDLGVTGRRTRAGAKTLGRVTAFGLLVGNASIPVAVLAGAL